MTDRYERIRAALAMGPTPGPWAACRTNSGTFVKSERLAGYFVEVRHCRTTQDVNADAGFIAACDPDTIRALLEERDALAAQQPAAVDEVKEPDLWRCTVCGRLGTVGRCCGEETRERASMEQLLEEYERLRMND